MGPGLAGVDRLIYAVAMGGVTANCALTGAHVTHIVIGGSDRNRSDRTKVDLRIRNRLPSVAAVGRFEDAAARPAKVIDERLTGNACHSIHTAAPEGADLAKFESRKAVAQPG